MLGRLRFLPKEVDHVHLYLVCCDPPTVSRDRHLPPLALGYYFGKFTFKGIGLGSVTATLLAGVLIGQIGINISQPLKATVFLLFLFAVGYGVGPQFVRGVAKDGVPQALFSVVQCLFSLLIPVAIAKFVGYDLGYAAGFYSGSQTISAAMGLSTDSINRLGLAAEETRKLLDSMPAAYAVTYMFGTVGSAIVIALVCPALSSHGPRTRLQGIRGKVWWQKELGGLAPPGIVGRPAASACSRVAKLLAFVQSKRKRWSPTRVSLSNVFAATVPSRMPPWTPFAGRRCRQRRRSTRKSSLR
jgi:hypothetical protein